MAFEKNKGGVVAFGATSRSSYLEQIHSTVTPPTGCYLYNIMLHACGGDQGQLSGTFTELKAHRPRLVLGWVITREDRAL